MKKIILIVGLLILAVALSGCIQDSNSDEERAIAVADQTEGGQLLKNIDGLLAINKNCTDTQLINLVGEEFNFNANPSCLPSLSKKVTFVEDMPPPSEYFGRPSNLKVSVHYSFETSDSCFSSDFFPKRTVMLDTEYEEIQSSTYDDTSSPNEVVDYVKLKGNCGLYEMIKLASCEGNDLEYCIRGYELRGFLDAPNVKAQRIIISLNDLPTGFTESEPYEEDTETLQTLINMFENEDSNLSVVNKIVVPKRDPESTVDNAYEYGISSLSSTYGDSEVAVLEENTVGDTSTLLKVGGNLYVLYFKKSNVLSIFWAKSLILSEDKVIQEINSYAKKVEKKIIDNVK